MEVLGWCKEILNGMVSKITGRLFRIIHWHCTSIDSKVLVQIKGFRFDNMSSKGSLPKN